jgi:condensin-2 complex subunit G2
MLRCLFHPMFLRSADGKKFLVYMFGLHPPFIDTLHDAIKAQIPACPKSVLEVYGEIYFKAWKVAQGPYLLKLGMLSLQCGLP